MPRGLLPRFIAACVGCVLVPVILRIVNISPDGAAVVELLYLLAVSVYLGQFLLRRMDEIPIRPERD